VRAPSIYALEDVNDLVGMLLLAGGPTEAANMGKVRVVRTDTTGRTLSHEYNVESYLKSGAATQNPECQSGDTIYVPRKIGTWSRVLRNVSLTAGIVLSGFAIYNASTR
jgi:protein involved in polysaccharide export with SLBB domain